METRGVTIHIPCDSIRFRLLSFDFDYFDSIMYMFLNSYNITCNVNNMQPYTLNLRIVTGTGGFTVAWFVTMFENLTKMVCLIWKFSRGGWRTVFLPGNTKWHTNCYRLCSSIKNAHFKEFWILILQYNNSLRAPWKRYAKIKAKSKRGSKELWIEPDGHNRD